MLLTNRCWLSGGGLRPSPATLAIGFGSGMTVSAVAGYADVQRIDCVEIEPAVLRAATYDMTTITLDLLAGKGLSKDTYCYACHFEPAELYLRNGNCPPARQNTGGRLLSLKNGFATKFKAIKIIPDGDVFTALGLAAVKRRFADKGKQIRIPVPILS